MWTTSRSENQNTKTGHQYVPTLFVDNKDTDDHSM